MPFVNETLFNVSDEFGLPNSIYEKYNRETSESGNPIIPARLFMYVIGREVDTLSPPKHMACNNKGINGQVCLADKYTVETFDP